MKSKITKSKYNEYNIKTQDGAGSFNFFTRAKNHKNALKRLQTNSLDYNNLVKSDRDLIITIKKLN